jgi:hypothetical protein
MDGWMDEYMDEYMMLWMNQYCTASMAMVVRTKFESELLTWGFIEAI